MLKNFLISRKWKIFKRQYFFKKIRKIIIFVTQVESEKVGLKLNIQKTKIVASGPTTSWEIEGETVETVSDFILGAPKSLQMVLQPWN